MKDKAMNIKENVEYEEAAFRINNRITALKLERERVDIGIMQQKSQLDLLKKNLYEKTPHLIKTYLHLSAAIRYIAKEHKQELIIRRYVLMTPNTLWGVFEPLKNWSDCPDGYFEVYSGNAKNAVIYSYKANVSGPIAYIKNGKITYDSSAAY